MEVHTYFINPLVIYSLMMTVSFHMLTKWAKLFLSQGNV